MSVTELVLSVTYWELEPPYYLGNQRSGDMPSSLDTRTYMKVPLINTVTVRVHEHIPCESKLYVRLVNTHVLLVLEYSA